MKKWSRFGNNYYPATEATVYEFPKTGVYKVIEENKKIRQARQAK